MAVWLGVCGSKEARLSRGAPPEVALGQVRSHLLLRRGADVVEAQCENGSPEWVAGLDDEMRDIADRAFEGLVAQLVDAG